MIQELKKAGADVMKFDLDDASTHDAALQGVHGVFVVTDFWEYLSGARETQQAKSIAESCKKAGVAHVVYSTLEDTRPFYNAMPSEQRPRVTEGDMYIPVLDGKASANQYFPQERTTLFHACMFLENVYDCTALPNSRDQLCPKGVFEANVPPDVRIPMIAAEDVGRCALAVFKAGDKYKGQSVFVAGDVLTFPELMNTLSTVSGKPYTYKYVSHAEYAAKGQDFARIADCWDWKSTNAAWAGNRDPDGPAGARALYPAVHSAAQWAAANKDKLEKMKQESIYFSTKYELFGSQDQRKGVPKV